MKPRFTKKSEFRRSSSGAGQSTKVDIKGTRTVQASRFTILSEHEGGEMGNERLESPAGLARIWQKCQEKPSSFMRGPRKSK